MKIHIEDVKLLSDNWYLLKKYKYVMANKHGALETHQREVYDRGNGATIFLYNSVEKKLILTRQFRIPTYLNGNEEGLLIECCAGVVEKDEDAEACIRRETEEEVGIRIRQIKKVFEAYMSPGAVTELITGFIGEYEASMRVSEGGGAASEQENIEVLELSFQEGRELYESGKIRDGKTLLLFQYAIMKELI
jgi:GDP-mannose pyrophosphatase NudK